VQSLGPAQSSFSKCTAEQMSFESGCKCSDCFSTSDLFWRSCLKWTLAISTDLILMICYAYIQWSYLQCIEVVDHWVIYKQVIIHCVEWMEMFNICVPSSFSADVLHPRWIHSRYCAVLQYIWFIKQMWIVL